MNRGSNFDNGQRLLDAVLDERSELSYAAPATDSISNLVQHEIALPKSKRTFFYGCGWLLWTLITILLTPVAGLGWAAIAVKHRSKRAAAEAILGTLGPFAAWLVAFVVLITFAMFFHVVDVAAPHIDNLVGHEFDAMLIGTLGILIGFVGSALGVWSGQRAWRAFVNPDGMKHNGWEDVFRWKDFLPCLLLWGTTGWMGGHRLFIGRPISGLFHVLTFGWFGLGWIADWYSLVTLSSKYREQARAQRKARWAAQLSELRWYNVVQRIAVFFLTPSLCVVLCVYADHLELLAVLVIVMVVAGLLGNVELTLRKFQFFQSVPLFKHAFDILTRLQAFYHLHRPRALLFYVFYPISAPIGWLMSPEAREEGRIFARILFAILMIPVAKYFASMFSMFDFLSPTDALVHVGIHLVVILFVSTVLVLPVITTSFKLSLSGHEQRLRMLVIGGLATALPVGALMFVANNPVNGVTGTSQTLLSLRLKSPAYRHKLARASRIFLSYYEQKNVVLEEAKGGFVWDSSQKSPQLLIIDRKLSAEFQEQIAGFVNDAERRSFNVFQWDPQQELSKQMSMPITELTRSLKASSSKPKMWLGIMRTVPDQTILSVVSPQGNHYTNLEAAISDTEVEGYTTEKLLALSLPESFQAEQHFLTDRIRANSVQTANLKSDTRF